MPQIDPAARIKAIQGVLASNSRTLQGIIDDISHSGAVTPQTLRFISMYEGNLAQQNKLLTDWLVSMGGHYAV